MSSSHAVAGILGELLHRIEANEAGVPARADEALHDFRVAVRRTRSARSLFSSVLPAAMDRRGRRFFSDLGRRTNAARDLEVLVFEWSGYVEAPEEHLPGLGSLRREIERRRDREYRAVTRWLRSKSYRRGMSAWRLEVEKLALERSGAPIELLAAKAIRRAAKRALSQAGKVGAGESAQLDPVIHRLRVRLKKLRYALEFSSVLTPRGEAAILIEALKNLQDELGAFQDRVVHRTLVSTAGRRRGAPRRDLESANWLAARLEQRVAESRTGVVRLADGLSARLEPQIDSVLEALRSVRDRQL